MIRDHQLQHGAVDLVAAAEEQLVGRRRRYWNSVLGVGLDVWDTSDCYGQPVAAELLPPLPDLHPLLLRPWKRRAMA